MNKHLCRAKRKDNNKWLYGYVYCIAENKYYIVPEGSDSISCSVEVVPDTIGRFIGLKDENDIMIFEEDICEIEGYIGAIEFDEKYGLLTFAGDEIIAPFEEVRKDKIVIKGNKQDNPQLLHKNNYP